MLHQDRKKTVSNLSDEFYEEEAFPYLPFKVTLAMMLLEIFQYFPLATLVKGY